MGMRKSFVMILMMSFAAAAALPVAALAGPGTGNGGASLQTIQRSLNAITGELSVDERTQADIKTKFVDLTAALDAGDDLSALLAAANELLDVNDAVAGDVRDAAAKLAGVSAMLDKLARIAANSTGNNAPLLKAIRQAQDQAAKLTTRIAADDQESAVLHQALKLLVLHIEDKLG